MLKRLDAPYGVGRRRGDWWKWKIDPYSVDAVLVYAQPGSGRRSNLFTDYTFAVWKDGALVPFAKAYSGLSDEEIAELDRWIRRHAAERFGPVRAVEPVHVFELGFEGHRPLTAPPVRCRRALPAHPPVAPRQDAGAGRHAGDRGETDRELAVRAQPCSSARPIRAIFTTAPRMYSSRR